MESWAFVPHFNDNKKIIFIIDSPIDETITTDNQDKNHKIISLKVYDNIINNKLKYYVFFIENNSNNNIYINFKRNDKKYIIDLKIQSQNDIIFLFNVEKNIKYTGWFNKIEYEYKSNLSDIDKLTIFKNFIKNKDLSENNIFQLLIKEGLY